MIKLKTNVSDKKHINTFYVKKDNNWYIITGTENNFGYFKFLNKDDDNKYITTIIEK